MKEKFTAKNGLMALAVLVLVYTLSGFFLVPLGMNTVLERIVRQELSGSFTAESLRFNPFSLTARIRGVNLETGQGAPALEVGEALVDLSIVSLFKLAPVIAEVRISSPKLSVTTDAAGRLVLPESLKRDAPPENQEAGGLFEFSLANLSLDRGEVSFRDGERDLIHRVTEIGLTVPVISTFTTDAPPPVSAQFRCLINGSRIEATGEADGFLEGRVTARARIQGSALPLAPYLAYAPLPQDLKISPAGDLSWDLEVEYRLEPDSRTGTSPHRVSVAGQAGIGKVAAGLEGQGPLLALAGISVHLNSPDILNQGVVVDLVRLREPEVFVKRDAAGLLPLAGLGGGGESPTRETGSQPPASSPPFSLTLARAELVSGRVHFQDEAVAGGFQTLLSPVTVVLEHLSLAGDRIALAFTGKVSTPEKEHLAISGNLEKKGEVIRILQGHLALEQVRPSAYGAYLSPLVGDGIRLERVDAASDFSLTRDSRGVHATTANGTLNLTRFSFGTPAAEKKIMEIPGAAVKGIQVDLDRRRLHIGSIDSEGGQLSLGVNRQGRVNLLEALAPILGREKQPDPAFPAEPWQVRVGTVRVTDYQVGLRDESRPLKPVSLDLSGLALSGENIGTGEGDPPGSFKVETQFQESGRIRVGGTLDLAKKYSRMDLEVTGIGIQPFQPYFSEMVNLEVTGGQFGADCRLDLWFPEGSAPKIRVRGEAGISDFSSRDNLTGQDFFRANSFFVSGLDAALWPVQVTIKEVSLTDFYNRAILTESGNFTYRSIMARPDPAEPGEEGARETDRPRDDLPSATIDSITLQGGHVNFTDRFTQPNYTANMTRIAGSISNLSTTGPDPADITLKGVHGLYSPLDITGKIMPFGTGRMADVSLSFKNIDLPQFTPYAEKYLGYEIETGKLVLSLDYHIRGDELSSSNSLVLDQFNLGKRVESKEATGLPVDLAISLLKNSKGQIDLDIPVSGNLQDPEFS